MARSKRYTVTLDREAAEFVLALYNRLDIGSPAEEPLGKLADKLYDSGQAITHEYNIIANGVPVNIWELTWERKEHGK